MDKLTKSTPDKEKILATWWGPLNNPCRQDALALKTHGKLNLPFDTDQSLFTNFH